MDADARRLLNVLSAPGDNDQHVAEARSLLGMTPGGFDEAFRYRWRGWLEATGHGPVNYLTKEHLATLRRVRRRRDEGEASLALCILGAAATSTPAVLAVSATDLGSGLAFWAGVVVAVIAAGTGVWKAVGVVYHWGRKIEDTFEAVADLKHKAERMELQQLATSEQIRDLTERLPNGERA